MVEPRSHVPVRLHRSVIADPLDGGGVDRPSHINVLAGQPPAKGVCCTDLLGVSRALRQPIDLDKRSG
jgi:hypothetical protein